MKMGKLNLGFFKGMIDAILREILEDPEAAFRTVAVRYQDFLVRCRIRRVGGEPLSLPVFRRRLAVARAGVNTATAEGSDWDRAVAFAATLTVAQAPFGARVPPAPSASQSSHRVRRAECPAWRTLRET